MVLHGCMYCIIRHHIHAYVRWPHTDHTGTIIAFRLPPNSSEGKRANKNRNRQTWTHDMLYVPLCFLFSFPASPTQQTEKQNACHVHTLLCFDLLILGSWLSLTRTPGQFSGACSPSCSSPQSVQEHSRAAARR